MARVNQVFGKYFFLYRKCPVPQYRPRMKLMDQDTIVSVLAGSTLALCLAGSAFLTLQTGLARVAQAHEELRRLAAYEPVPAAMTCDITAYCPERCCNSALVSEAGMRRQVDWSGRVSAGDFTIGELTAKGVNIAAVDPKVIPFGSIIEYGGRRYIALDTGSAIRGGHIDILLPGHEETVRFGVRRGERVTVLAAKDPKSALEILRKIIGHKA